jgi:hypothetical protein
MPVATARLVDAWRFFVSLFSWSACFVWKRLTISITRRRLISLAMAALIPFDPLGSIARFLSVFIIIPFVVEFLKTVYTGSRADLTIHISESWLAAWHIDERTGNLDLLLFCSRRLQTETLHVCFHQIGQQQVWEGR